MITESGLQRIAEELGAEKKMQPCGCTTACALVKNDRTFYIAFYQKVGEDKHSWVTNYEKFPRKCTLSYIKACAEKSLNSNLQQPPCVDLGTVYSTPSGINKLWSLHEI